jgi:hypothetical protein
MGKIGLHLEVFISPDFASQLGSIFFSARKKDYHVVLSDDSIDRYLVSAWSGLCLSEPKQKAGKAAAVIGEPCR